MINFFLLIVNRKLIFFIFANTDLGVKRIKDFNCAIFWLFCGFLMMIESIAVIEWVWFINNNFHWLFWRGERLVYTWITCFQLEIWPQCPQRKEPFNELFVEFVSGIPLLFLPASCDDSGVVKVFWELKLSVGCVLDGFELLACNWFAPPPRVRRFRLWTLAVDVEVPAWPFSKLFIIWNGIWMGSGGGGASSIPQLGCFSWGVPSSR